MKWCMCKPNPYMFTTSHPCQHFVYKNGLSHLFTNSLANSKGNKLRKANDSKGYNHNGHRLHIIFLSIKYGWDFGIFGTNPIWKHHFYEYNLKIKSYVFPYFKIQFLILIKYNHQSFYHLNKVDTKFPI
jgi:hypothetical protein